MIEAVNSPEVGIRESTVEAGEYEEAYALLVGTLAEGERLISVRRD